MLKEIIAVGDRTLVHWQLAETGEILRRDVQETFRPEALLLQGRLVK